MINEIEKPMSAPSFIELAQKINKYKDILISTDGFKQESGGPWHTVMTIKAVNGRLIKANEIGACDKCAEFINRINCEWN